VNSKYATIILIIIVILIGCYARFTDLSWHFSHVDDIGVAKSILDYKSRGAFGVFAVSNRWTYAPGQFLITAFLIHPNQTYRDLLFSGTTPVVPVFMPSLNRLDPFLSPL